jgi:hypothetical protein
VIVLTPRGTLKRQYALKLGQSCKISIQNFGILREREEHQKATLYRFPSASNNCPSQFELTLRSPWQQLRILFAVLGPRSLFHIASARREKAKRADHETMHAYALLTMCPTPSQKLVCVCVYNTMHRSHTQWLNSLQKANTLSPRSLLLSTPRYIFNHTTTYSWPFFANEPENLA